jgi:alanine dehydrogenase
MKIRYYSEKEVERVLNPAIAQRLAESVFRLMGEGKTRMPAKIYLTLPDANSSDFRAMPAYLETKAGKIAGVKWASVFPGNRKLKRPTVYATILLNSAQTGELLAVMEANAITAIRTAAAAAVATRWLANPHPKILAIVGSGLQAGYQLEALSAIYHFDKIRIWGYLPGEARQFCGRMAKFKNLMPVETVRECVDGADIIVSCTPSRRPLIRRNWVKKGAHINAIGADAEGKQELDPSILMEAKVVVDEWNQASHSGEINVPISKGLFSRKNLYSDLSLIVSGKKRGRTRSDETTVFDSTGLAILDVYFAQFIHSRLR